MTAPPFVVSPFLLQAEGQHFDRKSLLEAPPAVRRRLFDVYPAIRKSLISESGVDPGTQIQRASEMTSSRARRAIVETLSPQSRLSGSHRIERFLEVKRNELTEGQDELP